MEPQYERFFRWVSFAVVTPSMLWPGTRVLRRRVVGASHAHAAHGRADRARARGRISCAARSTPCTDSGPIYFDGLATLIFALLVGRYLQQRGQRAAADGAELLFSLTPSSARVVDDDGAERDVPAEALAAGHDARRASRARRSPPTASCATGRSQVDLSLLTGESRPVVGRRRATSVFAGTIERLVAARACASSTPARRRASRSCCGRSRRARARRAPIVETGESARGVVRRASCSCSRRITFVVWHQTDPSRAIDNAIALLVVTCPCALALSTPLAVSMAIGARRARRHPHQGRRRARATRDARDASPRQDRARSPKDARRSSRGTGPIGSGRSCSRSSGSRRTRSPPDSAPRGRTSTSRRRANRRTSRAAASRESCRGPSRRRRLAARSCASACARRCASDRRPRPDARRRCSSRSTASSSPRAGFGDPIRARRGRRRRARCARADGRSRSSPATRRRSWPRSGSALGIPRRVVHRAARRPKTSCASSSERAARRHGRHGRRRRQRRGRDRRGVRRHRRARRRRGVPGDRGHLSDDAGAHAARRARVEARARTMRVIRRNIAFSHRLQRDRRRRWR